MSRVLHYSDLENAYDDPERVARLAGLVGEKRDEGTLVVGTGDNLAPGVCSLVTRGRCALPFFDAVRPDIETFGNHDFDYGLDRVLEIVRESPQQWISANVFEGRNRFGASDGVDPYTVHEADGQRVGFVGVTDPATTDMAPGARTLSITDPIEAVEEVVEELRPGVDFLCVLSHCGALDEEIARRCDVDCVFGGHIHDERISTVGETVCIRPNANGHRIGDVNLDTGDARFHEASEGPIDQGVKEVFTAMRDDAGLDEVVGVVQRPISRSRERRLGGECRAGNFVADAYCWAADADCALHNSGGMRDGPPLVGEIETADLVSLVPFDERVVVCEVSGRELRAILAEGYRPARGKGRDGWYAHLSGVRVVYDTDLNSLVECAVGGEDIDSERTYSLATNAYLLSTRREFPTLSPVHRSREYDIQWKELAAYAREHGVSPRIDGRVVLRSE